MKTAIVIMGGAVLSLLAVSANAQETPVQPTQPTPPVVKTWEAKNNPTVDSIRSKYTGQYIAPKAALTNADIFPVIGQYESATNADAAHVAITLDETNKGVVWIEGLPQGRIKAMLRKSPGTYKIPVQKTADDKEVAEGTLIFDKETNTLSIAIGKEYNAADPAAVFAVPAIGDATPLPAEEVKVKEGKVKTKKKVEVVKKAWVYTGTKVVTETVAN
ncbi:MAG TPA: hypothetical protein VGO58_19955 [Chitinophagaceae bacterium]|jgi:hypothetical protein|nr:hypothetical protein [Chitinophagaceae bacterium]